MILVTCTLSIVAGPAGCPHSCIFVRLHFVSHAVNIYRQHAGLIQAGVAREKCVKHVSWYQRR